MPTQPVANIEKLRAAAAGAANNNEKVLPIEDQMAAHGVVGDAPAVVTQEKLSTITTGIEELREQKTSENIIKESLEISKGLEAQKADQDSKIAEVEGVLGEYAQKQKEKLPGVTPEVKLAPADIRPELQVEKASSKSLTETLRHTLVGDAAAALNRVGIRVANEPLIAVYEKFYQWRHGRTVAKEAKMLTLQRYTGMQEERLGSFTAQIEKHKKEGTYTPTNAKALESEKQKIEKVIENLKMARDTAHARWEKSSNKDAHWRNAKKQVAEHVISKTEEGKRPYQHEFEALRENHTAAEARLEEYRGTKEKEIAALKEFEKKIAYQPLDAGTKARYELQVAQIKEVLAENDTKYSATLAQSRGLANKMNATNRRISQWQNMGNEFARKGNRSHAPGGHEAVKEELGDHHDSKFSHEPGAPKVAPTAPATPAATATNSQPTPPKAPEPAQSTTSAPAQPQEASATAPERQQESGEAIMVKPVDYIKKWNELFSSTLKIDAKVFTDHYRIKPNEPISSKVIEDNIVAMVLPGVPLHKEIFIEGIKVRFAKTREALTQGGVNNAE